MDKTDEIKEEKKDDSDKKIIINLFFLFQLKIFSTKNCKKQKIKKKSY